MITNGHNTNDFFDGLSPIEIDQFPMFPTPWNTEGVGSAWTWNGYFLILQKHPRPVFMSLAGKKSQQRNDMNVTISYAMLVYEKIAPGLTLSDKPPKPVFAVSINQIYYGSFSPGILLYTYDSHGFVNHGQYRDPLTDKAVTEKFFSLIRQRFALIDEPKLIGRMEDAFGNPLTGLDKKENYDLGDSSKEFGFFPSFNSESKNPIKRKIGVLREKSSGVDPLFIKFLISCFVIVALCVYLVVNESKEEAKPVAQPDPPKVDQSLLTQVKKPPEGTDQVLGIPEINWCIAEQIALDTQEKILKNKNQVKYYNERVKDYNKRCSRFRYKPNEYRHAIEAVNEKRKQIVEEAHLDLIKGTVHGKKPEINGTNRVAEVQRKLKQLKYSITVDGDLGPITLEAIKRFQKSNGMPMTGIIDDRLIEALDKAIGK